MKILRAFVFGMALMGCAGIAIGADKKSDAPPSAPAVEAAPTPTQAPTSTPASATPAERLLKTAAEWKVLAAKKRLAAEAEKDESKKKIQLDAALKIEEFAIRTQKQAEAEMVFEKDLGVREARAFEEVAVRRLLKSQEDLEKVRSQIQALGASTDARNREKAALFKQSIKALESSQAALDMARKKTAAAQEKALKKAAKAKR